MLEKTKIVISESIDPWYNLSLEEHLINTNQENECTFYLWQNDKTVVIGKNQNPWRECRVKELEADGGKLARRLSGGGAVYHGIGNLNFTFILPKDHYDLERQMGVILKAVGALGINAEKTGRNDITVDGKKFSGNAFLYLKKISMHHGTVLVKENMKNLGQYLQVSKEKIESKGVKSVQSRVGNLIDYNEQLTVDQVRASLIDAFKKEYDYDHSMVNYSQEAIAEAVGDLYEKNGSWDWRYGKTMKFDITLERRFAWGEVQIHLSSKNGEVTEAAVYSDALEVDYAQVLQEALLGGRFDSEAMVERIKSSEDFAAYEEQNRDVMEWLKTMQF